MTKFETGKTYSCRSICDYDTIFSYTVIKRSAKMITIENSRGQVSRRGVKPSYCGGHEMCHPDGVYSMCPTIRAE